MAADLDTPDADLVIPKGYVAERVEGDRLRVYAAETGIWIGEVESALSNAQQLVDDLLSVYESGQVRQAITVDVTVPLLEERTEWTNVNAFEQLDEDLRRLMEVEPNGAVLRIRELEKAAALAADSLTAAGDEATAQIVKDVLAKRPECLQSEDFR